MVDSVVSMLKKEFKSENNLFSRVAGKSFYEVSTGKKPYPMRHFAKQAAMVVGQVALAAVMQEATALGMGSMNILASKGGDFLLKKTFSMLGNSSSPFAHAALRITQNAVNKLATGII